MAMNKKEQAELARLKHDLALTYALRWTSNKSIDPDVDIHLVKGGEWDMILTGYSYNAYSCAVVDCWTGRLRHGHGEYTSTGSASQNSKRLYSTKLLALQAMRYEIELQSAVKLAEIDRKIEAELANESK